MVRSAFSEYDWGTLVAYAAFTFVPLIKTAVKWDKYTEYQKLAQWLLPEIAYKLIWLFMEFLIIIGWFICWQLLDHTTSWFISIQSITIAFVFFLKVWPYLYFNWENSFSSGTILAWVLAGHASIIAALSGYRGYTEEQYTVFTTTAFFGIIALWLIYVAFTISWFDWNSSQPNVYWFDQMTNPHQSGSSGYMQFDSTTNYNATNNTQGFGHWGSNFQTSVADKKK